MTIGAASSVGTNVLMLLAVSGLNVVQGLAKGLEGVKLLMVEAKNLNGVQPAAGLASIAQLKKAPAGWFYVTADLENNEPAEIRQ
jgi:hypothetical protein